VSYFGAEGEAGATRGSHAVEGAFLHSETRRLVEVASFAAIGVIAVLTYLVEGSLAAPFLVVFGFTVALIDTAFGMGYGTLATPILLVVGFGPIAIVPAVLLSQALAAAFATALHVTYKNVDLLDLKGTDAKISVAVIAFGVIGVIAAVVLAVRLPSLYVKSYIGVLVVAMGLLLIVKPRIRFSWSKVYAISAINGFDKAISGGGFGPVAVGGLLSLGQRIRNAVGITVFTVTVINFAGVGFYFLLHAMSGSELFLMATLSIGAVIGSLVGPGVTGRLNTKQHLNGLAYVIIIVGALTLAATFLKF
jgi:uncharacterized membrane protein YfcA